MKKYFVVADVHSFYFEMMDALNRQGFDKDNPEHIFVSLGDLLDRGDYPLKCLDFVNSLPAERKILICGNHEDLLEICLANEEFLPRDLHNGTFKTVMQLGGICNDDPAVFEAVRNHSALKQYLADLVDYAEIGDYIFVHGWIPSRKTAPNKDWRLGDWAEARWFNGMEKWRQGARIDGKTILCGHWHTSWGHSVLDKQGSEFGPDADFSPFIHDGIIALDACTVVSKQVNCITLEV